jgi:hypothetical protein
VISISGLWWNVLHHSPGTLVLFLKGSYSIHVTKHSIHTLPVLCRPRLDGQIINSSGIFSGQSGIVSYY